MTRLFNESSKLGPGGGEGKPRQRLHRRWMCLSRGRCRRLMSCIAVLLFGFYDVPPSRGLATKRFPTPPPPRPASQEGTQSSSRDSSRGEDASHPAPIAQSEGTTSTTGAATLLGLLTQPRSAPDVPPTGTAAMQRSSRDSSRGEDASHPAPIAQPEGTTSTTGAATLLGLLTQPRSAPDVPPTGTAAMQRSSRDSKRCIAAVPVGGTSGADLGCVNNPSRVAAPVVDVVPSDCAIGAG